jgi:hypothetical protein
MQTIKGLRRYNAQNARKKNQCKCTPNRTLTSLLAIVGLRELCRAASSSLKTMDDSGGTEAIDDGGVHYPDRSTDRVDRIMRWISEGWGKRCESLMEGCIMLLKERSDSGCGQ